MATRIKDTDTCYRTGCFHFRKSHKDGKCEGVTYIDDPNDVGPYDILIISESTNISSRRQIPGPSCECKEFTQYGRFDTR